MKAIGLEFGEIFGTKVEIGLPGLEFLSVVLIRPRYVKLNLIFLRYSFRLFPGRNIIVVHFDLIVVETITVLPHCH